MSLRVCVVMKGASRLQGGLHESVPGLWAATAPFGVQGHLRASHDVYTDEDRHRYPDCVDLRTFPTRFPHAGGFSPSLLRGILGEDGWGAVSIQGLWEYPAYAGYRLARERGLPVIVSPRGMLDGWALRRAAIKKRLVGWLFHDRLVRGASCLHALNEEEARAFRRIGLRAPVAVIPNGISLPRLGERTNGARYRWPGSVRARRLLYLGRLHPKKGLPQLLRAWGRVVRDQQDWSLVIAGPDSNGTRAWLEARIDEDCLGSSVVLLDSVYGEDKAAIMESVDGFVLPSLSEGFSMALLEAASYGVPSVYTRACAFPELEARGGGLEVDSEPRQIERGMRELMGMDERERRAAGEAARRLVAERYTWDRAGEAMAAVCHWLAGGGDQPSCVQTTG